jgi:hypothetical protein
MSDAVLNESFAIIFIEILVSFCFTVCLVRSAVNEIIEEIKKLEASR